MKTTTIILLKHCSKFNIILVWFMIETLASCQMLGKTSNNENQFNVQINPEIKDFYQKYKEKHLKNHPLYKKNPFDETYVQQASRFFQYTNNARLDPEHELWFHESMNNIKKTNLSKFHFNQSLSIAAQKYAQKMIESGFFSHIDKSQKQGQQTPQYRINLETHNHNQKTFLITGENLHKNTQNSNTSLENNWNTSQLQAIKSLMKSKGHRKNILNKKFSHIGIGVLLIPESSLPIQFDFSAFQFPHNSYPRGFIYVQTFGGY